MVGLEIDVRIRVCLLTEHRRAYATAVSLHQNVEKGDLAIDFLLGCELDVGVLVIQVFVELTELLLTTTPYCKDIVDISEPDPRSDLCRRRAFLSNDSMNRSATMGDSGDSMAAPSSCSKNPFSTWK